MKFPSMLVVLFAALGSLAAKEKSPPPGPNEVVTLESFEVRDRPIGSFTISIRVLFNLEHKLTRILIVDVTPGSDAEKAGLSVGDEIVKIDGVPVEGMDPVVEKDTQLGKIFLNRTPGDPLALEVLTRRTKQVTLRANRVTPGSAMHSRP